MGQFALPLAILSAGFQAYSAFSDASAQKARAKAQSQIAANNAIIAENNAKYAETQAADARDRGAKEADNLRRKLAKIEGSQRAGYAAAGVTLDTGSPLDILQDTNYLGNEDITTTLKNADREAMGYRMGAYNYRSQGANATAESNMYRSTASGINPYMSAAGSLLSSASTISSKWNSFGSSSAAATPKVYTQGPLPWLQPGYVNP